MGSYVLYVYVYSTRAGGEKKLKSQNNTFKFVQAAEVAIRTLSEFEPLRVGNSSGGGASGSTSRLRKLSVGLLEGRPEGRPVFSTGGGATGVPGVESDFDVGGGATEESNGGAQIVRSSSMSMGSIQGRTSNSPRPSIDVASGVIGPPPTAARPKHNAERTAHGNSTSAASSSSTSKWTSTSSSARVERNSRDSFMSFLRS